MNITSKRRLFAGAIAVSLVFAVSACGDDDDDTSDTSAADTPATDPATDTEPMATDGETTTPPADSTTDETMSPDTGGTGDTSGGAELPEDLSGTLVGAGATSQEAAMAGWQAGFQTMYGDVTVEYDAVGSGGGRETFLSGGADFAGSDAVMDDDEYEQSVERCAGDQGAIHLPHYISPIAVAYNLPDVDALNLSPETVAGIFAGEITTWNDEAIAADNPDVELPDTGINPVHRSDESGTTENFTDYLGAVAPDVWTDGPVEVWPDVGGEGANGTSGVVGAIGGTEGAIGYADASQVGDLGTAAIGVGDKFVEYSPEAAAQIVDVSKKVQGRNPNDFAFELTRDTTEAGVYPIALVSYHIVCQEYDSQEKADLVKAFMTYVSSEEGQQAAAEAAGSAPISDEIRQQMAPAIDSIGVAS